MQICRKAILDAEFFGFEKHQQLWDKLIYGFILTGDLCTWTDYSETGKLSWGNLRDQRLLAGAAGRTELPAKLYCKGSRPARPGAKPGCNSGRDEGKQEGRAAMLLRSVKRSPGGGRGTQKLSKEKNESVWSKLRRKQATHQRRGKGGLEGVEREEGGRVTTTLKRVAWRGGVPGNENGKKRSCLAEEQRAGSSGWTWPDLEHSLRQRLFS